MEHHASSDASGADSRSTFRIGSGAEWSRAATYSQRRGRSSTTEPVLAGQSAHARRWSPFCKAGPLSALRRKRSGKMDSVTHTIFDQRALESRRLRTITQQFGVTDANGLITKNAEMMNVAGSRYERNETRTFACEVCQQWFTRRRLTARFCRPRCRQRAHRRASPLPFDKIRSANEHSQQAPPRVIKTEPRRRGRG